MNNENKLINEILALTKDNTALRVEIAHLRCKMQQFVRDYKGEKASSCSISNPDSIYERYYQKCPVCGNNHSCYDGHCAYFPKFHE